MAEEVEMVEVAAAAVRGAACIQLISPVHSDTVSTRPGAASAAFSSPVSCGGTPDCDSTGLPALLELKKGSVRPSCTRVVEEVRWWSR